MNSKMSKAPRASSNNRIMVRARAWRHARWTMLAIVGTLVACATRSVPEPPQTSVPPAAPAPGVITAPDEGLLPGTITRAKSQWVPVRWSELPGWGADALHEAWNAWLRSCERPAPTVGALCAEVRRLSIATAEEQRSFIERRLQPYRISATDGNAGGLLTGYYEPTLKASRTPTAEYAWPLHKLPASVRAGQPWFSRQDMDTLPQAQAALRGQEIAWLADPIDMMLLHIQGSGRLLIQQNGQTTQTVRVAFAGTNNQPYRSINTWLQQQGAPITPWPEATKAWVRANPQRVNELLWSNPRYVFFREEALSDLDAQFGPRGAQGVALTPGRSIAVDPGSVPYGTPVWLSTQGPAGRFNKLVLAQDTGSAIVGAVRADYFTGWGDDALALAAGLKQPLQLWALWPR
ncbi:MAG TPA: MltA domain-containing protein [Burkholderiaceae bacterium]|nr:MltA domain-containing protein [Burkholderiaceae bacterium]